MTGDPSDETPVAEARRVKGAVAFRAGMAAEDAVARHYERRGFRIAARRFRRPGFGEIDLVAECGSAFVVVEVKASADHARAAARLSPRQITRLCAAAEVFLAEQCGSLERDVRFDLATVNALGEVRVTENAIWLD